MTEATKESNKALESISQSMVAVGKSIKDGLALHVTALSGVQTQQKHHRDTQNIHLENTIMQLFNFLTHSAEIFLMTITESRF